MITGEAVFQDLAKGFPVGMRFHSARVVRLADGKPIQIGHVALADGAWRIYVFGDRSDPTRAGSPMNELFEFLGSKRSPLHRYTPAGVEPDAVIDLRAIFQQHHRDVALGDLPTSLLPRKGRFGLIDYEKVFCPDPKAEDIFDLRDIDRGRGCMVVVRPDQYVSHVLPLNGYEQLNEHFERVLIRQD